MIAWIVRHFVFASRPVVTEGLGITYKAHFCYEMSARIIDTTEDESGTNVTASVVAKKFSALDAPHMLSCS